MSTIVARMTAEDAQTAADTLGRRTDASIWVWSTTFGRPVNGIDVGILNEPVALVTLDSCLLVQLPLRILEVE